VPLNRREQRRADRAEAREAEAAAREARANKINAYEEKRRQKEADREARERAQVRLPAGLYCWEHGSHICPAHSLVLLHAACDCIWLCCTRCC